MSTIGRQKGLQGLRFTLRISWITTSAYLSVVAMFMRHRIKARLRRNIPTPWSSMPPLAVNSNERDLVTEADFQLINQPGFGDSANTYAWSMQWWQGKLYVGTARVFQCVEFFALHTTMPSIQKYPPRHNPGLRCTESPYDLPLRGELWCYTPETKAWERVYQSPNDVAVPGHPGTFIARDIGYRDMIIFTEPDGTEALYVSGVSARSIDNNLPLPSLLRSTDGKTFTRVPHDLGKRIDDKNLIGFRSMLVHGNRLYVVAGTLYGDGALFEVEDPGGKPVWRRVSPPGMKVYSVASFNDHMYLGTRDTAHGYAVVKTDLAGPAPYHFTPIVINGGFRKPVQSHLVLSMNVFKDHLYVGTEYPGELLRIHADDHWDLIMGKQRRTPYGKKRPLSRLGDGFGYALNVAIDRMQVHNGWLYLGTNDLTALFRNVALTRTLIQADIGIDVYASQDGINFTTITRTGFGDQANGRTRTFASSPLGLFVGTANLRHGAKVYLGTTHNVSTDASLHQGSL